VNLCGLVIGVYLVSAYSVYNMLALYCVFNILLLWIIQSRAFTESSWLIWMEDSNKLSISLAISLLVLLFVLIMDSYERIYTRSSLLPPLLAVTLVIVAILALASIRTEQKSFFTSNRFLLPMLISITLFVNFSIYLVQPNPFANPLFATVDSYRDFANAARIVKLSGFRPEDMVATQYYAELPVVPILISILSLVGGLSIQEGLIVLAVALEILGVVGVWLLSTAVVRSVAPAFASTAGVLAVILVWLQPYFIDPASITAPLRLSIPLLMLVLYRALPSSRVANRSSLVSILMLGAVIVPMHATSAFVLVAFCILAGLLAPTDSQLWRTVVLIASVLFGVYLLSGAATPYTNLLVFATKAYYALAQFLSHGPAIISQAAESPRIVKVSELSNFTVALPLALALSMCTLCVAKSWRLFRGNLQTRKLNLIHLAIAVLAFAGLAGGYIISLIFRLDMRYFAYPTVPLLVVACAVVLSFALRNIDTSRMRALVLIGVMIVYAISMAGSPQVLYETSATLPRLIPTESESAAGNFVSTNMQITQGYAPQILSDWPFYNYIQGVAFSSNIGIERKINVVDLMFSSPNTGPVTYVILRQYYLRNVILQNESPHTGVLKEVGIWNSPKYNKIYDSSTTWVYLGTFEG